MEQTLTNVYLRIIEVSSHSGARPKCAKDQGKLYDLDNGSGYVEDVNGKKIRYYPFSSTSYGKPDGLFGINCRHHMYPFVPGCSTQKYFPYDEEENSAQYKKVQKQRELERKVRASKRECMMLKDGDPEAFKKASVKLKHNTQQLKTYCSNNDLMYMNERTSVMGYGRSEAGKVTAAYNRALKQEQEKLSKVVDISGGSGIINKNTVNAVGKPVEIVERTEIKGKPNSITQKETAKGGIDRNYYGDDGVQTKQISNNGHGHKVEEKLGKHGEHAHDYYRDDDGKIHHGKARELNDEERKENDDIL